jgi:glutaminase
MKKSELIVAINAAKIGLNFTEEVGLNVNELKAIHTNIAAGAAAITQMVTAKTEANEAKAQVETLNETIEELQKAVEFSEENEANSNTLTVAHRKEKILIKGPVNYRGVKFGIKDIAANAPLPDSEKEEGVLDYLIRIKSGLISIGGK